jgi:hypothetical protein
MMPRSDSLWDIGGDIKHPRNHWGRGQTIGDPVAAFDDPPAPIALQGRIRSGCRQSCVGCNSDAILCSLKGEQEVDCSFHPSNGFEVRYQAADMNFGFRAERDHVFCVRPGSVWTACIRAMLARRRSRTGSSGTISPAAICASLRSSDSDIQPSVVLSSTASMDTKLGRNGRNCQQIRRWTTSDRTLTL